MPRFTLRARFARRMPDPVVKDCDRHILLCAVEDIPPGLPLEKANVRPQNTNRRVYKEVAKHLRNENDDGARNIFHLKNKGITILAMDVECVDKEEGLYEIVFSRETQGIVDGGHTYQIITENQNLIAEKTSLSMRTLR